MTGTIGKTGLTGTTGPGRRIIANLDCECAFAAWNACGQASTLAPHDAVRSPSRRAPPVLRESTRRLIAGYGTLLRAFARDGDRVWIPAPVDADRVADVAGLPRPDLEWDPIDAVPAAARVLAWGETSIVSGARGLRPAGRDTTDEKPRDSGTRLPVHERLWRISPAPPDVVARMNHRGFGLELARSLGVALPGARMVSDLDELLGHLAAGGADAGHQGAWVVKAPHSAAGRWRAIGRGVHPDAPDLRSRVPPLLDRHGPLLFEPWMDRVEDLGTVGIVTPAGVEIAGVHRQIVDAEGRFRGIEIGSAPDGVSAGNATGAGRDHGTADVMREARDVAIRVGEALRMAGYTGPFGVDAWRYRRPDGSVALNPLGEINARMTFGLVAHALVERLRDAGEIGFDATATLVLGSSRPAGAPHPPASGARTIPLLLPDRRAVASGGAGGASLVVDDRSRVQ